MTRIAFIGLGNMGSPMVQHLIAAGHAVRAYVRRPEAAEHARALG
ncbi:NAD(P)-binding domain-containing protein, partial [Ralstonia pseudosolanacearum]